MIRSSRLLACSVVAVALSTCVIHAQHPRLFDPRDLGMLEGPDRESYQRPEQIMDALYIGDGSVVADVGAGGGWFTVRLARRVGPNGVVYAQDIQPLMIQAIEGRVRGEGLHNVKMVLGTALDPRLPEPIDAALIVDTYHEMEQPITLLRNLAKSLKPAGLIGIVDFKKDGFGPGPDRMEDRVDPERVIRDAQAAGLQLKRREDFLRYEFLLIFGLPSR